jgi:hypothetical protein
MNRFAIVKGENDAEKIGRFMPGNYQAKKVGELHTLIYGQDSCGWTLEDYVIPRLASGLYFAEVLPCDSMEIAEALVATCGADGVILTPEVDR